MQSVLLGFCLLLSVASAAGQSADSNLAALPELEAPLDWTVEESDEANLVLAHEAPGARLAVTHLEQIEEVAGDVLESTAQQLAGSVGAYLGVDVPAVEPVMFRNQPAFEFKTDDGTRTRLQRLFERRGQAFSVTIEAPNERFSDILAICERMLGTLKLYGE